MDTSGDVDRVTRSRYGTCGVHWTWRLRQPTHAEHPFITAMPQTPQVSHGLCARRLSATLRPAQGSRRTDDHLCPRVERRGASFTQCSSAIRLTAPVQPATIRQDDEPGRIDWIGEDWTALSLRPAATLDPDVDRPQAARLRNGKLPIGGCDKDRVPSNSAAATWSRSRVCANSRPRT
jgi:hypothetical protein